MENTRKFYIDGAWVEPVSPALLDVVDPSTEEPFDQIALGSVADVDRAVAAARAAFPAWSVSKSNERLDLLRRILAMFTARINEIAATLSREMGAPLTFALDPQAASGIEHLSRMIEVLETYSFQWMQGTTLIAREPIGVVRADHAMELADQPDRLQGGPGDRRRLHDGAEAVAKSRR